MGVIVIGLGTPRSAGENFGCAWERLGAVKSAVPSVLGPDGDGAVFLNVDGDGEVTVPGNHPPSPADNGRLQNIFR